MAVLLISRNLPTVWPRGIPSTAATWALLRPSHATSSTNYIRERAAREVQLASFDSCPGHRYNSWRGVAVPGGVLLLLERGWRDEASLSDDRRGRPVGVANDPLVLFRKGAGK